MKKQIVATVLKPFTANNSPALILLTKDDKQIKIVCVRTVVELQVHICGLWRWAGIDNYISRRAILAVVTTTPEHSACMTKIHESYWHILENDLCIRQNHGF